MPPKGKGTGKRAAAAGGAAGAAASGGSSKKAKAEATPDKKLPQQQASITSFLGGSGEKKGGGHQKQQQQQTPITAFFGSDGGAGGGKKPAAAAAERVAVVVDLLSPSSGTEEEDEAVEVVKGQQQREQQERQASGGPPPPQIDLTLLDSPPAKKPPQDVMAVAELVASADGDEEGDAVVAVEKGIEELPSVEGAGGEEEDDEGAEADKKESASAAAASAASAAAATPPTRAPHPFFGGKPEADASSSVVVGSPVDRPCGKYRPREDACWKEGEAAPYLHMAWAFELLCSTTKRLTKADVLVNMFRSLMALSPQDVLPAVYLSSNRLASSFEGVDINVGAASVSAAIVQATASNAEKLKQLYTEYGDLGDVAQALRVKQRLLVKPKPLAIRDVYRTIVDMSKMKGQGCEGRKRHMMVGLIRACRGPEAKFLVRTLVQHIRTGATLTSVLAALAMAAVLHHMEKGGEPAVATSSASSKKRQQLEARLKEAQAAVKECYNACPDIPNIVRALVEGGVPAMQRACAMRVGTPIKPMLAKICSGIPDMLEKYAARGEAPTHEYKYDGQRAQLHLLPDGTVKIFNRHIEDMTDKYPDVAALLQRLPGRLLRAAAAEGGKDAGGGGKGEGDASSSSSAAAPVQDMILDAELVAVDRRTNKLLAFQTLATRGRKDVTAEGVAVHVCVFAFDLLYLNGASWVKKPLRERRAEMYRLLGPAVEAGHFDFATHSESAEAAEVEEFFNAALEAGCEGIMCKSLEHEYEPSKRTDSWLKVKKDYIEGLHDTLDLVPIAAWWGNGRKAGWFSPILVACYDPQREEFQSLCRVMSGLSDDFYRQLTAFYQDGRTLDAPKPYYRTGETPPIWLEPCQVWEVRGAELTVSPVHKAALGKVDSQRGLSLRFPRFLRVRDDKGVEDATPADTIADLFRMQVRRVDVPEERMGKTHGQHAAKAGGGKKGGGAVEDEEEGEEEDEGLMEDFEL